MGLTADEKKKIVETYHMNDKDTGSASVQVALLTERVNQLTGHLQSHHKDHHSRRGLLKMVARRRKLLKYVHRQDPDGYGQLIKKLNIRG